MNLIECAISRETAASHRYEELATAAVAQEQQELFTLLAASEREHLRKLLDLKRELAGHGRMETAVATETCPLKPLPPTESITARDAVGSDGYADVTRAEAESIAFYEDLAAKAENPELRRLCQELAMEERQHAQQIERIFDFVEGPKNFLAWGEFSNLRDY